MLSNTVFLVRIDRKVHTAGTLQPPLPTLYTGGKLEITFPLIRNLYVGSEFASKSGLNTQLLQHVFEKFEYSHSLRKQHIMQKVYDKFR